MTCFNSLTNELTVLASPWSAELWVVAFLALFALLVLWAKLEIRAAAKREAQLLHRLQGRTPSRPEPNMQDLAEAIVAATDAARKRRSLANLRKGKGKGDA